MKKIPPWMLLALEPHALPASVDGAGKGGTGGSTGATGGGGDGVDGVSSYLVKIQTNLDSK
jgi:hypothetical protein